ncbi:MAG: hypothetical protein SVY41_03475 [Candidatus Nanohaloarchaea archaeon]|nr:hypothetical protein [Candidatus Nanohaloarchaea archaeon]
MTKRRVAGLIAGSVLVSAGGGVAALGMAGGSYLQTYVGFAVVLAGYRAAQYATYPDRLRPRLAAFRTDLAGGLLATGIFAAGLFLFSAGFVFGAQAGLQPALQAGKYLRMAASGVTIVTGMLITHNAVNGVAL